jgi:hypothetical protein
MTSPKERLRLTASDSTAPKLTLTGSLSELAKMLLGLGVGRRPPPCSGPAPASPLRSNGATSAYGPKKVNVRVIRSTF